MLTQQKCGNGARIKAGHGSAPVPRHEWNIAFLKNEDNKKELFAFISKELSATKVIGRLLLTTHLETVLSNKDIDLSSLELCNHSEADTRIILHLAHAAEQGHTYFHSFGLSELWVRFGCGKYYHDIPVHAICSTKSQALPLFHSFWVWKEDSLCQLPNLTDTLIKLTQYPRRFTLESEYMAIKMFHFDHVQQGMWCKECE